MTREEIKIEIQKSLERVPDGVLADILEILNKRRSSLPEGKSSSFKRNSERRQDIISTEDEKYDFVIKARKWQIIF